MKEQSKDKIRKMVRESYANIARGNKTADASNHVAGCCGHSQDSKQIRINSGCGCGDAHLSFDNYTKLMGYSVADISGVPDGANLGLGCGNPVALASLKPGETLVDLGSGAGFDCFLAARQVGETGQVVGVDMTPYMITKARENAEKSGFGNVEFRLGEIEHLPVGDAVADIIISNCVINLSPDKLQVFKEAFRVLKPGGRIFVSDIVATAEMPDEIRKDLVMVSACIGGAATIEEVSRMLEQAGFANICITPQDKSREMIDQWVPGRQPGEYIVSATIEAVKPG